MDGEFGPKAIAAWCGFPGLQIRTLFRADVLFWKLTDVLRAVRRALHITPLPHAVVGVVACADRYAGGMAWVTTAAVLSQSGVGGREDDEGQRGDGRSEKAKHFEWS